MADQNPPPAFNVRLPENAWAIIAAALEVRANQMEASATSVAGQQDLELGAAVNILAQRAGVLRNAAAGIQNQVVAQKEAAKAAQSAQIGQTAPSGANGAEPAQVLQ